MHQNTFLTTPEANKIIFKGLYSGGQEMHQNTFLTTPEVNKIIFKYLIMVIRKCIKPLQS
jgi:hypothetical protein